MYLSKNKKKQIICHAYERNIENDNRTQINPKTNTCQQHATVVHVATTTYNNSHVQFPPAKDIYLNAEVKSSKKCYLYGLL